MTYIIGGLGDWGAGLRGRGCITHMVDMSEKLTGTRRWTVTFSW